MQNISLKKQNIAEGSSHISKKKCKKHFDRVQFMLDNMDCNHAYKNFLKQTGSRDIDTKILKNFQKKYYEYRDNWLNLPATEYKKNKILLS